MYVCMYVYMYVCMYVYYIYIYIHLYVHTYISLSIHVCVCVYIYIYTDFLTRFKISPQSPAARPSVSSLKRGQTPGSSSAESRYGSVFQGNMLHTRNHESEIPLEKATENPLDNSSEHQLEK